MTGEGWSPAILFIAAALSIAIAPTAYRLTGVVALIASAVLAAVFTYPSEWQQPILAGSWLSIMICALAVYRRQDTSQGPSILLAVNAGIWAGAVTKNFGSEQDLLQILPLAALTFPAGWLAARRASIVLKVLASWLIAVTILMVALPMVATPGYVQDHMN